MSRAKALVLGASHWHAPLYAERIAVHHEVLGVSDANAASAEHFATLWKAPFYASWEDLLSQHGDADLAYVFVPHDEMRQVCLALIALGVPVVVEKPVGVSLSELTDVRAAAEAAGVPIAIPLVQRGGPADVWLSRAGSSLYESAEFIAGPPDRYLTNGSPWMVQPERAGGGCLINLAPHFVDLFLHSSGAKAASVSSALSSRLHGADIEDFASLAITTDDGRIATIQVGYAFPGSPLKRHCAYLRIGTEGTSTIWSDGRASFSAADGRTETAMINVDSDPLYGLFVDEVASQLDSGFPELPGIRDLEATMKVIWDAYAFSRERGNDVHA